MDWFTADLHLGHANIIRYCRREMFLSPDEIEMLNRDENFKVRPESVKEMDSLLIDEINKVVLPADRLYIVGDFCFGRKNDKLSVAEVLVKHYRNRIACKHIELVFGNHEKKLRRSQNLKSIFFQVHDKITINVRKQKIVLDHEAHAIWDCRNHGAWHLYGHSHGGAEAWLDQIMPGRFSMDVGIDWAYKLFGAYRPFSFDEIKSIMDDRFGFGVFSHG